MASVSTRTGSRLRPEQFKRAQRPPSRTNVGDTERWLSILGGGALALYGLQRGTLGGLAAAVAGGGSLVYRGVSGYCALYSALGVSTAQRGPATVIPAGRGVKVEETTSIERRPEELYQRWRKLEDLPHFMRHLDSVRVEGNRSHWVAKGPLGIAVEWDAEIYNENPNEMIAWRSLEGSEIDTVGSVHFTPGPDGRGTLVRVVLKYAAPAGKFGSSIAQLLGDDPQQAIREDLRRFKQLMEAGGPATTQGQTSSQAC